LLPAATYLQFRKQAQKSKIAASAQQGRRLQTEMTRWNGTVQRRIERGISGLNPAAVFQGDEGRDTTSHGSPTATCNLKNSSNQPSTSAGPKRNSLIFYMVKALLLDLGFEDPIWILPC
jgi:hypothetical protein